MNLKLPRAKPQLPEMFNKDGLEHGEEWVTDTPVSVDPSGDVSREQHLYGARMKLCELCD